MPTLVSHLLYRQSSDAMGTTMQGEVYPGGPTTFTKHTILHNDNYELHIDKPAGVDIVFTQQVTDDYTIDANTNWVTVGGPVTASGDTIASYPLATVARATRFLITYTSGAGLVKLWLAQERAFEQALGGGTGTLSPGNILVAGALNKSVSGNDVTLSVPTVSSGNAGVFPATGGVPGSYYPSAGGSWLPVPGSSPDTLELLDICESSGAFMTSLNRGRINYPAGGLRLSLLTELNTGEFADGAAARHTVLDGIRLSAFSGLLRYTITGVHWDTLSTGPEKFVTRFGFLDTLTNGNVQNGVFFDFDVVNTPLMRCSTAAGGIITHTNSSFTPVAGVAYDFRIEVTNGAPAVFFYRDSIGQGAWTTLVTRPSGIPNDPGQGVAAGVAIAKSAGTTSRGVRFHSQRIYQLPA